MTDAPVEGSPAEASEASEASIEAQIVEALGTCAERNPDINNLILKRFYALSPHGEATLAHADEHMLGRMMEQVYAVLMDANVHGAEGYWRWEVENHVLAYGVSNSDYPAFFQAVLDVVQESLGEDWTVPMAQAWHTKIERLLLDSQSP